MVARPTTRSPHRRRGPSLAAACVVTLSLLATACFEPPDDLQVSVVVGGQDRPWDLAFTPDGTLLWTERPGDVSALVDGSQVVLDANGALPGTRATGVRATGEGGMMGLAVDPEFTANRHVYTCFLTGIDVRVVRWTLNAEHTALEDRSEIVTGMPAAANGRHSGCRPRFAPDGYLWIGTGDAAQGTNPQDPTSLGGKVLRVDRDGNPAPGNPGPPLDPRIYTYGHRNVQGLAFDRHGFAYSIEHGTACDDEVNLLVAGGNYGWDPVPGYDESTPMTDLTKFPDAIPALWSSGCPTIAPSGGTFLYGEPWVGWSDALAIAVLKDQHLHVLRMGAPGGTSLQVIGEWEDLTGYGRLRSAVQGPDGDLYLTQDTSPGAILRVTPVQDPAP